MIRIAVDAMGGDHAPSAIVDGALAAARHLDLQIFLVGVPTTIALALERHTDWRGLHVHVIEAPIGHDGFLTEIGQLSAQLHQAFFA